MVSVGSYTNMVMQFALIKEIKLRQKSYINFFADELEMRKQYIEDTLEIFVKNPDLAKFLYLQIKRSVSQTLNRLMESDPYINYFLIFDTVRKIFLRKRHKKEDILINSENLLGKFILINQINTQSNALTTFVVLTKIDPYGSVAMNAEIKL
ncbi:hypothetical protein [Candidatus Enterovibrio escicola]|nr:hypothetical protein [Candidatus Enterovibrio escacola]